MPVLEPKIVQTYSKEQKKKKKDKRLESALFSPQELSNYADNQSTGFENSEQQSQRGFPKSLSYQDMMFTPSFQRTGSSHSGFN